MAENDKNQGGPLNLSGLVVALSIVAAAFLVRHDAPLDITRPIVSGEELYHGYSDKSVEARLWQDPFAAVARSVNGGDAECKINNAGQTLKSGGTRIDQWVNDENLKTEMDKSPFRVMIVTTSGAPYAANVEFRRRIRYAVLAGLHVKNYTPYDYAHIDYFTIECATNGKAGTPRPNALRVPYEWFEPANGDDLLKNRDQVNKSQDKHSIKERILLLWMDENYLLTGSPNSFDKLKKIIDNLCKLDKKKQMCDGERPKFPVAVIGPETTELRDVIFNDFTIKKRDDSTQYTEKNKTNLLDLEFYSYGPTASYPKIDENKKYKAFRSTIPDDRKLAEILYQELKSRGVDPKSGQGSIAFVSEWDTEYGRTIVCTMTKAFDQKKEEDPCKENSIPDYIKRFYSRGLDGAISPDKQKKIQTRETGDKGLKSPGGDKQNDVENAVTEKPIGPGQYDYMRRLAQELKHKDEELRRTKLDNGGIRAIGVFGNDVYDKLVALRALKADFPEAVFFTTDYDATLQMKDQTPYTRNLLVASGYGPELKSDYQRDIPPFRSTYQTSAFYATQLAIDDEDAKGLDKPVIYQVDRKGELIQLKINNTDPSSGSQEANPRPEIPPLYPQFTDKVLRFTAITFILCGIFIMMLTLYLYSCLGEANPAHTSGTDESRQIDKRKLETVLPFIFGCTLLVIGLVCAHWPSTANWLVDNGAGEPLVISGGLSIWPTILCRLSAIVLSIILMFLAQARLRRNMIDIEKSLGLKQIFNSSQISKVSDKLKCAKQRHISQYLKNFGAFLDKRQRNFDTVELEKALDDYKSFESFPCKIIRVSFLSIASTLIFSFALDAYGMGEPSLRNYTVNHGIFMLSLWVEIFFVSALCIYIIDSVILCLAFIEDVAKKDTVWPQTCMNSVIKEIGVRRTPFENDNQILQSLVDLLFIQSRTECVLPLVYSPFFVIALTILSRSNAFDAFPTCWVAILGDVFAIALIFLCAHAMNRQAMIVREAALERLENGILRAKSREMRQSKYQSILASSEQLEKLKDWVANLSQGAFSAPLQQPLFRGLIMPFAGLGLNLMADYGWLPIL